MEENTVNTVETTEKAAKADQKTAKKEKKPSFFKGLKNRVQEESSLLIRKLLLNRQLQL